MQDLLKPLVLAALLVQAGAAIAQETTTEDNAVEDASTETETENNSANTDLSLGEPVEEGEAALQVGQPYLLQEFGDWQMRCIKAPEGETDPCNLYQLLLDEAGNQVAEVNLFRLPAGGQAVAGANIVAPLETLLTEQLTIAVDGANARRYPFTFCNSAGCVARVGFTAGEVDQFRRGNVATVRLVPAADPASEVVLRMSLSGFTAGFGASTPLPN